MKIEIKNYTSKVHVELYHEFDLLVVVSLIFSAFIFAPGLGESANLSFILKAFLLRLLLLPHG